MIKNKTGVWGEVYAARYLRDNGYKISVRTGEEIDASAICGKLGGGGHRCAAGCFVEGDLETAKETVLKVVAETLGEETE